MRRGLLAWSAAELPAETLDARIDGVRAAARAEGLDAVLVYSSFARPQALSDLTGVVPFFFDAVLVVPAEGPTLLVGGLPKRDVTVLRPCGKVDEVRCNPDNLAELISALDERGLLQGELGLFEIADVPWRLVAGLQSARGERPLRAFSDLPVIQADDANALLFERAADLGRAALAAPILPMTGAAGVVAAAELAARSGGAEEVQVLLAPDFDRAPGLRRIEADEPLGARYALAVSLAYKGRWLRAARLIERASGLQQVGPARQALSKAGEALTPGHTIAGAVEALRATGGWWSIETAEGGLQFRTLAASGSEFADGPSDAPLGLGQVVVLSVGTSEEIATISVRVGGGTILS